MTIIIRSSYSAVLTSKTTAVAVFFIALMCGFSVLFGALSLRSDGMWHTLYVVSLAVPVIGIMVSVVSFGRAIARLRRPVCVIDSHVTITESRVRFPVEQLSRVHVFSTTRANFATVLPSHDVRDDALADYTFGFPGGATIGPAQLVDTLNREFPHVRVTWKG